MARKTTTLSIRLTDDAIRLRAALADKLGLSLSAVVELALRQMAKREGVK
jgi:antitoxin component of RelBE/YafQ-DinJ toxin-antitoxin module